MRPIRLSMTAFGPFGETQVLDFTELGSSTLFLIHGPTGSGKTSILDAVCFALYGESSGDERDGRALRSDHAGATVETEVSFDFLVGERRYRVLRAPQQERAKKRGTGTTVVPPRATLWRLRDADGDGEVLASQWSRVTGGVEDLLGFSAAEFRQVIMLPQGQFQDFLKGRSDDRQRILEVLFETGLYRRIENALKAEARGLEKQVNDLRARNALILEQAGVETAGELGERLDGLRAGARDLEAGLKSLKAGRDEAGRRLVSARRDVEKLDARHEAEAALGKLRARADGIARLQEKFNRACAAATLEEPEKNLRVREDELAGAEAREKDLGTAFTGARKRLIEARKNLTAQAARKDEREAAAREVIRLEGLTGKVNELAAAGIAAEAAAKKLEEAVAAHDHVIRDRDVVEKDLAAKRGVATEAGRVAAGLDGRRIRVSELERVGKGLEELAAAREKLSALEAAEVKAARAEKAAAEGLERASKELETLTETWSRGQATLLAGELVEGAPCPVCGSTEHPHPARASEEVPTEAKLASLRQAAKRAGEEHERLRKELVRSRSEVGETRAGIVVLVRTLEEEAATGPDVLAARLREARADLDAAEKAVKTGKTLAAEIGDLGERLEVLQKRIETSAGELTEARSTSDRAGERAARLAGDVPEALRSPGALEKALETARTIAAALARAFEAAQTDHADAENDRTKAEADATAAREQALKIRETVSDLRANFLARVTEEDFASEEDYRAARLTPEDRDRFGKEIQDHRLESKSAEDRVRRTREESKGIETPDLDGLTAKAAEAEGEVDAAAKELNGLEKDAKQAEDWLARLGRTAVEASRLEDRYGVVGRVADAANGQNTLRMTFQRFVLATLLERVLVAATARLLDMSRGRFRLQRAREQADRRAAGGLDLEVFDAHTGTQRSVTTLSGGESFQAALSLALGLADVVQSYAGGLRMDTIFVDEGFGSLDSEALDLALNTLMDLRRSGRLVGIISHVDGLKERIDARLEVRPGPRGSTARFVTP